MDSSRAVPGGGDSGGRGDGASSGVGAYGDDTHQHPGGIAPLTRLPIVAPPVAPSPRPPTGPPPNGTAAPLAVFGVPRPPVVSTELAPRAAMPPHVLAPAIVPKAFARLPGVEQTWLRAASLRPPFPVVAVSSADGGVGRSTLAAALSAMLALACPRTVLAVDATGLAWGGLADRVGVHSQATVWDALAQAPRWATTAGSGAGVGAGARPDVTPMVQLGPTGAHALVGETTWRTDRRPPSVAEVTWLVEQIRGGYGVTVLDLPYINGQSTATALWSAAAPVLVARASEDSLRHVMRLLSQLRGTGRAGRPELADRAAIVVMHTVPSPAKEARAAMRLAASQARALVEVPFDQALARPAPIDPRRLDKATRRALVRVAEVVLEVCPADPEGAAALAADRTGQ